MDPPLVGVSSLTHGVRSSALSRHVASSRHNTEDDELSVWYMLQGKFFSLH